MLVEERLFHIFVTLHFSPSALDKNAYVNAHICARCLLSAAPPCPPSVFSQYSTASLSSLAVFPIGFPSSSNARTIFLACPGCTRSSRVDVVNNVLGHFQSGFFIVAVPSSTSSSGNPKLSCLSI